MKKSITKKTILLCLSATFIGVLGAENASAASCTLKNGTCEVDISSSVAPASSSTAQVTINSSQTMSTVSGSIGNGINSQMAKVPGGIGAFATTVRIIQYVRALAYLV